MQSMILVKSAYYHDASVYMVKTKRTKRNTNFLKYLSYD
jgi:hypothetical protein